eukprot:365203-Chlamydomonas_euryale.AAC.31
MMWCMESMHVTVLRPGRSGSARYVTGQPHIRLSADACINPSVRPSVHPVMLNDSHGQEPV